MADTIRLDCFLWFVRLVKTRSVAQAIAAAGHVRVDGRPVAKPSAPLKVGQVLTLPIRDDVRVIRVEALPVRRGPFAEARECYAELSSWRSETLTSPPRNPNDSAATGAYS